MAGSYTIHRKVTTWSGDPLQATVTYRDITWEELRESRRMELEATDWWAVSDRTMTDAQKNYRTFLRDMPANHSSANDAADAWSAYDITGL